MPVSTILMGGLGNTLFQISCVLGYSIKYEIDYCIPDKIINPHKSDPVLYKFPGVTYCDQPLENPCIYTEPHFHYKEIPDLDCDDVLLNGYFQSYKYFDAYREEILKTFGFDDIQVNADVCSIHLRLGDYKQFLDHHPIVSKEYIGLAIGNMWFKGYKNFLVFSDEIEEAKEKIASLEGLFNGHVNFEFSEGKSAIEDLRLMAACSSSITGNSTLSLFAAWVNPNPRKVIISPRRWFGEASPHDTSDLYLPQTIIL